MGLSKYVHVFNFYLNFSFNDFNNKKTMSGKVCKAPEDPQNRIQKEIEDDVATR